MLDIGFAELLLIAIVALLVLGPERMPEAVRSTSQALRKLRNSFNQLKTEFEREIGSDELKRDLHNESILKQLEKAKQEAQSNLDDMRSSLTDLEYDIQPTEHRKEPNEPTRGA